MNIRIQTIIAVLIIISLAVMTNMIRKKAIELRYALAWIAVGISVLILDLAPGLMGKLATLMGIATPVNMLFFLGFCFALIIIFVLTVAISRMSVRIKNLAQEIALYEKKMNEEKESNCGK